MRIGLLIDSLIGGGAERITLNFAETFSALGHDVHIFILINNVKHSIDTTKYKLHILTEDGQLSKNKWLNKIKLTQTFQKKISNIESHQGKFAFFISSSADFDRISRNVPNVYIRYRNSMWEFIQSKIGNRTGLKARERFWRYTLKHRVIYSNRNIIAIANAMQVDLCEKVGIKPKSITTIYNPFDFKAIRLKANTKIENIPNQPYIIYVAKFENRKNHKLLIDAYAKSGIDHLLVLIGDTYTESDNKNYADLKDQIKKLKLEHKIIFPGFQTNPYPWIKNAKLFAMSSNNEGLPTVLIEALILDVPVVSTDCPTGPSEILVGEFSRFLSPVNDVEQLAQNIKQALHEYPPITSNLLDKFDNWKVAEQYISYCDKR